MLFGTRTARTHDNTRSHLVENSMRNWITRQRPGTAELPPRAPRGFTIAISREFGVASTAIAGEVGKLLGWQVYDRELLEHIAEDMDVPISALERIDERQQNWLIETMEGLMSSTHSWRAAVGESAYVHHLVKVVQDLGQAGSCVIVGRGAAFILPAATTLRIRLVAPLRERVAAAEAIFGVSEAEAAERVETIDSQRAEFIRDHFSKDCSDPHNYDVVLNVARMTVAASARAIVAEMRIVGGI